MRAKRAQSKRPVTNQSRKEENLELLLGQMLGRFNDALAVVETAHSALDKSEKDQTSKDAKVLTLWRGIEALKSVYSEYDLTLSQIARHLQDDR